MREEGVIGSPKKMTRVEELESQIQTLLATNKDLEERVRNLNEGCANWEKKAERREEEYTKILDDVNEMLNNWAARKFQLQKDYSQAAEKDRPRIAYVIVETDILIKKLWEEWTR